VPSRLFSGVCAVPRHSSAPQFVPRTAPRCSPRRGGTPVVTRGWARRRGCGGEPSQFRAPSDAGLVGGLGRGVHLTAGPAGEERDGQCGDRDQQSCQAQPQAGVGRG